MSVEVFLFYVFIDIIATTSILVDGWQLALLWSCNAPSILFLTIIVCASLMIVFFFLDLKFIFVDITWFCRGLRNLLSSRIDNACRVTGIHSDDLIAIDHVYWALNRRFIAILIWVSGCFLHVRSKDVTTSALTAISYIEGLEVVGLMTILMAVLRSVQDLAGVDA